jgi:hypothetical protein
MSKRCQLQKEYYQTNGSYKGNGNYDDKYVCWLEDKVLSLRKADTSCSLNSAMNEIENAMERWHLARDNKNNKTFKI